MLPSAECLYLLALFLCIMSCPVVHSLKHVQKLSAEFSRRLHVQTSEIMMRSTFSYFDFSWHLCCIIFFLISSLMLAVLPVTFIFMLNPFVKSGNNIMAGYGMLEI